MSDDLIERLLKTPLYEASGEESDLPDEAADRIRELEAENKALRAGRGVKVKPLGWVFDKITYTHWSECRPYSEERTSAHNWSARPKATRTTYDIMEFVDDRMKNRSGFTLYIGESETRHDTLDGAKAAAQADYERRILSALTETKDQTNE